jgi:hypothetical protein
MQHLISLLFHPPKIQIKRIGSTLFHKLMLEKTEGAINNGQSRDTGNTGYTRQRMKTNKTKTSLRKLKR